MRSICMSSGVNVTVALAELSVIAARFLIVTFSALYVAHLVGVEFGVLFFVHCQQSVFALL